MTKANSSTTGVRIYLAALVALPVVLYLIPLRWITDGQSICLFKNISGHACYGCGMTRAVFSLLHGDPGEAFAYNKLVVIVVPLLLILYVRELVRTIKRL